MTGQDRSQGGRGWWGSLEANNCFGGLGVATFVGLLWPRQGLLPVSSEDLPRPLIASGNNFKLKTTIAADPLAPCIEKYWETLCRHGRRRRMTGSAFSEREGDGSLLGHAE